MLCAALAACSSGSPSGLPSGSPTDPGDAPEPADPASEVPTASPTATGDLYVALGDSYTAAPLVPETDSSQACLRSDANYPRLVAAGLPGTELVDVSCVGATSESMTRPQRVGSDTAPPQLDALSDDVDLVTIGVGGNDFDLFTILLGDCLRLGQEAAPTSCRDRNVGPDGDALLEMVRQIETRVAEVVTDIRERAPQARVVVVTYPRLLPEAGSCPELIPLADPDYAYVTQVNRALSRALADAAEQAGADVADLYAASAGHDICSEEPWVNGIQTDTDRALALHPFAEGQQAAAQLVLDLL